MIESPEEEARAWLHSVLQLMGIPAQVEIIPTPEASKDPQQLWIEIGEHSLEADHLAALLEKDGEALDALQYLLNAAMHVNEDRQQMYTVELAGVRLARQLQLAQMAREAAEKVRATTQEFVFGGLSAAERRQIHLLLRDEPDLDTFSRGKEPDRRLVVRPKGEIPDGDEA
jgi:spoIIIJ-associated protein